MGAVGAVVHSIPPMLRSMQGGNLRVCTKRWGRSTPTPQVAPAAGGTESLKGSFFG